MSAHAKMFQASGMSAWSVCTLKPWAEVDLPDRSSAAAEEGTAAHEFAADVLSKDLEPADFLGQEYNKHFVDYEMINAIEGYVDRVRLLAAGHPILVEQEVNFRHLTPEGYEPGEDDMFGTADAIIFNPDTKQLIVVDLKYGQHFMVYAENNPQLSLYAAGAVATFASIIGDQIESVRMVIDMPRKDHVDEHVITMDELKAFETYTTSKMHDVIHNPVGVPGEAQCRWCKAKATCKARTSVVLDTLRDEPINMLDLDVIPSNPSLMTNEQLAILWAKLGQVKNWVKDVETHVKDGMADGQTFAGLKMVAGKGSRSWKDETKVKSRLSRSIRMPKEEYLTTTLISVAQAEKKMGKIKFKKMIDLVDKSDGAPVVALEADKRPSLTLDFLNLETGE